MRTTESGVQLVAWTLQGRQWRRWTGPIVRRSAELQESWMRSQQLLGNEPGHLNLLDDVSEIQAYFFRNNGWSNAQSSGDRSPATPGAVPGASASQRELLPSGVRLVLTLGELRMTRDVMLAPQLP